MSIKAKRDDLGRILTEKYGIPFRVYTLAKVRYGISFSGLKEDAYEIRIQEGRESILEDKWVKDHLEKIVGNFKDHFDNPPQIEIPLSDAVKIVEGLARRVDLVGEVSVGTTRSAGHFAINRIKHSNPEHESIDYDWDRMWFKHRILVSSSMQYLTEEMVETIGYHELAHAVHMETWMRRCCDERKMEHQPPFHGSEFWSIFEDLCPGAKNREREIDGYWSALFNKPAPLHDS